MGPIRFYQRTNFRGTVHLSPRTVYRHQGTLSFKSSSTGTLPKKPAFHVNIANLIVFKNVIRRLSLIGMSYGTIAFTADVLLTLLSSRRSSSNLYYKKSISPPTFPDLVLHRLLRPINPQFCKVLWTTVAQLKPLHHHLHENVFNKTFFCQLASDTTKQVWH